MDQIQPHVFSPSLKKVLKSYQTVAMSTLQGPSGFPARWVETHPQTTPSSPDEDSFKKVKLDMKKGSPDKYLEDVVYHPPPFPIQQIPVFTPLDQSRSERSETILEGETISCFIVGGEKRLCLPQILNSVLRDFSLQQINSVCDDLHIYCSRCNPEQLETLKIMGILPFSAPSCGLITKTDAERLCNKLLHEVTEKPVENSAMSEKSFKVYHECFGKCKGVFSPELYTSSQAKCIECMSCHGLFTPQRFVCHAHKASENRTCHWGFDSANWRSYLLLAKDQDIEKYQEPLEEMKAKFDFMGRYKRKLSPGDEVHFHGKKAKLENSLSLHKSYGHDAIVTSGGIWMGHPHSVVTPIHRLSAFRPWSPTALGKEGKLKEGFVDPTGLVREGFDKHFQPNVALAPPTQKSHCPTPEGKPGKAGEGENAGIERENKENVEVVDKEAEDGKDKTLTEPAPTDEATPTDAMIESSLEQELDLVKNAFENNALDNKEAREKLLHELAKLRVKKEERLNAALVAKKNLQQELEFLRVAKKEKLREATEAKRSLRKEIERLRSDHERRLKEVNESRLRLKRELELARSKRFDRLNDISKSKAKLKTQVEQLREKLDEVEKERDTLRGEVERERKLREEYEQQLRDNNLLREESQVDNTTEETDEKSEAAAAEKQTESENKEQ
ncbi:ski oncogene-like isoform X2 [Ptychodera flava]|uniref:ski oncogene-like isoform X2 n=1 Tax=Ptychodera flava TaxID=63121 RepID=UPI00396A2903